MNKKKLSIIFYIIAGISLVIGAAFHGFRMHPENVATYNVGVTMGIVMVSICVVSLIVGIVLTILSRREGRQ